MEDSLIEVNRREIVKNFTAALDEVGPLSITNIQVNDIELMREFLSLSPDDRKKVVKMMKAQKHSKNKKAIKKAKKKGDIK